MNKKFKISNHLLSAYGYGVFCVHKPDFPPTKNSDMCSASSTQETEKFLVYNKKITVVVESDNMTVLG